MGLIKDKGNEPILTDDDKLLGTSGENNKTVNFPLLDVYEYITTTKGVPTSRFATTDIVGLNSASLASGDHLIFYDVTDSSLKKVDASTFLGIQPTDISGLTTVTGVAGDFVPIWDATDSTVKKVDLGDLLGGGAGDVTKVGTPANNQIGVWTGDGTIEGDSNLLWSGTVLTVTGNVNVSGTVDGRDIGAMNLFETDDLSIPAATNRYVDIANDSSIVFRQGGLTDILTLDGDGNMVANLDIVLPASAYSGSWNGDQSAATKDAIYDKVESLQLSNLTDVGTTTPTNLNVLAADGVNFDSVALTAAHIQSGTFADARIAESNVTQHQAALSIVDANLTDDNITAKKLAMTNATLGAPEDGYVATYDNASGGITWEPMSGGASQLSDLSDVNTSTPTNRNVLVADGVDWESRALVEADISDLQAYALDADVVKLTGAQNIAGVKKFTSNVEISTNGSSFASPTKVTFVDFSTGEAARLGFGDDYNTVEAAYGNGMALHCYNTIYLYGGRELLSALEATADYPNIADVAVQVAIEQADKSFQVKTLHGTPTAPLQTWTNSSDTDVASMSAAGDLTVANEAYGVSWNGSLEVPTKDAVYDEMETKITASSTDTLTNKTLDFGNNTVQAVPFHYVYALSDEISDLTTGTGKLTIRAPHAMTITDVRAHVTTAPTGSGITVDINEAGVSILSTKLTIDATEKTSETAATAAVISDTAIADDAEISFDIDAVGSTTTGKGLKVAIIGTYNP